MIILWWDESEEDGEPNDNSDNFDHTLPFIVISSLAHHNVDALPYASPVNYSHSSDLRTFQEIFHVKASGKSPYLGDAANAHDLSDLFEPGVIPTRAVGFQLYRAPRTRDNLSTTAQRLLLTHLCALFLALTGFTHTPHNSSSSPVFPERPPAAFTAFRNPPEDVPC